MNEWEKKEANGGIPILSLVRRERFEPAEWMIFAMSPLGMNSVMMESLPASVHAPMKRIMFGWRRWLKITKS